MAGNDSELQKTVYRDSGERPEKQLFQAVSGNVGQTQSTGSTAMLIRIFGRRDREPYGDIVHHDLKKPVPYQGSAELVLRIDAISRSLDHPAPGNTFRSIGSPRNETGNVLPEEYWQEQNSSPPPRVRDTIYLQLIGRQHTSIQGRIWGRATRKKYITFRSALELIYLLSEAV